MSCAPENRQKFLENVKQLKRPEGVEFLGLFYPRGSNYMFAGINKYKDYATWEKIWAQTAKERGKGFGIIARAIILIFSYLSVLVLL